MDLTTVIVIAIFVGTTLLSIRIALRFQRRNRERWDSRITAATTFPPAPPSRPSGSGC
jgi:hypothetical protein